MKAFRFSASGFKPVNHAVPAKPGAGVLWLRFEDEKPDRAALESWGKKLGIHELALEDAATTHQRPKFENYGAHYFLVLPGLNYGSRLQVRQISLFMGKGWVLSISQGPQKGFEAVEERLRVNRSGFRSRGAAGLLHALIDGVVDAYVPVLDQLEERFAAMEEQVATRHPERAAHALRLFRQDLFQGHRMARNLEEALQRLHADPEDFIPRGLQPFFRDLLDHGARAVDRMEHLREGAADLLQISHAAYSQRTNDVMQVLTVISTIFMPLTFIVGVYGMNFDHMPELRWHYGYLFSWLLMIAVALGFLVFFRRRGWLGQGLFWRRKK